MCNENREWRTDIVASLNANIQRTAASLAGLDDQLIFYMREHRSLELDVMALGEALGHPSFKDPDYYAKSESPSVLLRRYIEDVRQLTCKPEAWKGAKIDTAGVILDATS